MLRKLAFDEPAGANHEARERDAQSIAQNLSVHSYEWLLDEHWSNDRLVLDLARTGSSADRRSSIYNEAAPNAPASITSRTRLAEILDGLRFTFGPDDAREGAPTPYQFDLRADEATRAQAGHSKALSISHLIGAAFDSPHIGQWTINAPVWWLQDDGFRRAPLNAQMQDRKPSASVGIHNQTLELTKTIKPEQVLYQQELGFTATHGWATRISEVGFVLPRAYDDFPSDMKADARHALPQKSGPNGWTFDGKKQYAFVELVANFSAVDAPVRQQLMEDFAGGWRRHWKLLVMNPEGSNPLKCDVLKLPSTRVICVDMACNPQLPELSGGDAESADARYERTALNRLIVFDPISVGSARPSNDARTMPVPAVASFNRWMFRWRSDTPQPLSLRDVKGESLTSRREVESSDSFARAHPASYMLVLFDPNELPPDTHGQQIRWCCQRLNTFTDTILLNAVDFPRESRPFEEGYEAIDLRNNRDARISWKRTQVLEPGDSRSIPRSGNIPHEPRAVLNAADPSGAFKVFTGTPAFRYLVRGEGPYYSWCDGLNEHAIGHYLPGGEKNWFGSGIQAFGRYDIEDRAGARSWPFAAANEAASTVERYGSSRGLLQFESDLRKVPLNWFSYTSEARDGGALIPDADLRSWGDLFRVTPLEQQLTAGFLSGDAYGRFLEPNMYWLYPCTDGLDNDCDGRIDAFTSKPRVTDGKNGHYQSDRRSVGRMNLNELTGPAALWYAGLGTEIQPDGNYAPQNLMTALGRRPHKGYVSAADIFTKLNLQSDEATPYNALIWPENSYADLAVAHAHAREQYDRISQQRMALARTTTVSHSTVYTICCTGQTIDRTGYVKAQARMKVTIERTPEGRMNILEWAPLPE
ncbi:MAG TPA: hypothetical protein VEJ63_06945 [Planctomycetota bacterium]|nr:hypothetical protein [Planctomycetota bacterium]